MKFYLKWQYPLDDNGKNNIYAQTVKLKFDSKKGKVEMPSFCMGIYLANMFNACKVEYKINGYRDSQAFIEWKNIVGETYLRLNDNERGIAYILFDSIAYPAFCIFKNVRTMLEEIGGDEIYTNRGFSQCTLNMIGDVLDSDIPRGSENFVQAVQSRIDLYITQFNELLMLSRKEFDFDFYEKLCDCLRRYNESEMVVQYLAGQEEKGRCFATFIEDETNKKYISFSGFVDAVDRKIITWLNRSAAEASSFVGVAIDICSSMGAEFVPINLETRRYSCINYPHFAVKQGASLDDIIRYNLKSMKKYYSCCERKIFGHFLDNTPNGKLYVKLKICGECSLGLFYQLRNGNVIVLFDGLEC